MSELKFTCPACGQHMQCEKAYCGDKTTCPSCNVELRVPFSHTPPEPITMLPKAELVSVAAGATKPVVLKSSESALTDASVPIVPSAPAKAQAVSREHETHCICPVCKSELRVPGAVDGETVTAEAVSGPTTAAPTSVLAQNPTETESITEREKQIVAARESNPVSLYPAMKPRLAYILSGGESVAGQSDDGNKTAPKNEEPPPPIETVTE